MAKNKHTFNKCFVNVGGELKKVQIRVKDPNSYILNKNVFENKAMGNITINVDGKCNKCFEIMGDDGKWKAFDTNTYGNDIIIDRYPRTTDRFYFFEQIGKIEVFEDFDGVKYQMISAGNSDKLEFKETNTSFCDETLFKNGELFLPRGQDVLKIYPDGKRELLESNNNNNNINQLEKLSKDLSKIEEQIAKDKLSLKEQYKNLDIFRKPFFQTEDRKFPFIEFNRWHIKNFAFKMNKLSQQNNDLQGFGLSINGIMERIKDSITNNFEISNRLKDELINALYRNQFTSGKLPDGCKDLESFKSKFQYINANNFDEFKSSVSSILTKSKKELETKNQKFVKKTSDISKELQNQNTSLRLKIEEANSIRKQMQDIIGNRVIQCKKSAISMIGIINKIGNVAGPIWQYIKKHPVRMFGTIAVGLIASALGIISGVGAAPVGFAWAAFAVSLVAQLPSVVYDASVDFTEKQDRQIEEMGTIISKFKSLESLLQIGSITQADYTAKVNDLAIETSKLFKQHNKEDVSMSIAYGMKFICSIATSAPIIGKFMSVISPVADLVGSGASVISLIMTGVKIVVPKVIGENINPKEVLDSITKQKDIITKFLNDNRKHIDAKVSEKDREDLLYTSITSSLINELESGLTDKEIYIHLMSRIEDIQNTMKTTPFDADAMSVYKIFEKVKEQVNTAYVTNLHIEPLTEQEQKNYAIIKKGHLMARVEKMKKQRASLESKFTKFKELTSLFGKTRQKIGNQKEALDISIEVVKKEIENYAQKLNNITPTSISVGISTNQPIATFSQPNQPQINSQNTTTSITSQSPTQTQNTVPSTSQDSPVSTQTSPVAPQQNNPTQTTPLPTSSPKPATATSKLHTSSHLSSHRPKTIREKIEQINDSLANTPDSPIQKIDIEQQRIIMKNFSFVFNIEGKPASFDQVVEKLEKDGLDVASEITGLLKGLESSIKQKDTSKLSDAEKNFLQYREDNRKRNTDHLVVIATQISPSRSIVK